MGEYKVSKNLSLTSSTHLCFDSLKTVEPRTKNNITKITKYGTANKTVELMFAKMPPKITDTLFMPYSSIA